MADGSQYGEDKIILDFFEKQTLEGTVVDVGAADGWDNSNSFYLLDRHKTWRGILIEPEPTQFEILWQRYKNRGRVSCVQNAVGTVPGSAVFHTCLQVSTLNPAWKKRCEDAFNVQYGEMKAIVRTLTDILDEQRCSSIIDFLTIDCEGVDMDVLRSLDLTRYHPRLICMEGFNFSIPGYREFTKTGGNTFYVPFD